MNGWEDGWVDGQVGDEGGRETQIGVCVCASDGLFVAVRFSAFFPGQPYIQTNQSTKRLISDSMPRYVCMHGRMVRLVTMGEAAMLFADGLRDMASML